ncbi:DnaJ C-terminal domain-containing protein [Simiduia litorea]
MEFKDYYQVLGVTPDASADDIKRAYRKLARKYHPDVSKEPDAEAQFKAVNEANEVLKDAEKRAAYDQLSRQQQAGEQFRPPPGWERNFNESGDQYTGADSAQFSDFFDSIFGGHAQHAQTQGQDIHARLEIDLLDSFTGAIKNLTLPVTQIGQTAKTLQVRIPRGVHQGGHIRLAGQGYAARGNGKAGDLFLEISFRPDKHFHVQDKDIFLDLPVTPWEAALGAKVQIPTPTGKLDVKIPAGTSHGRKLRLTGQGIPAKSPGDLYVVIQIALPPAHSDAEKKAYAAFAEAAPFNPRANLGATS